MRPGLFNPSAVGRVSPLGNFTGDKDAAEYFFALPPVPSELNGNLAFYKAEVVHYTSSCDEIASSVVYFSAGEVDPKTGRFLGGKTTILKQVS